MTDEMPTHSYTTVMSVDDLNAFIARDFQQIMAKNSAMEMVSVAPGIATMRLTPDARHLRPGGTVSGPSLFALADVTAYMVILAHIGPAKHTVTTNLNINFMLKAEPGAIDCECRLLKLGKRLAVVDAQMRDGAGNLVAQATATYSIPANNTVK